MNLLYLSRADVRAICAELDPVTVIRSMLALHAAGDYVLPDEAYLRWSPSSGGWARSLNLPGYLGGEAPAAGLKVINANPANPDRGLPRADGLSMIFDTETAQIRCVMDGSYLSALRTAAISAVATDLLAVPDARSLTLLGSGALASAHLELLPRQLPALRRIVLFDLVGRRAETLAAQTKKTYPELTVRVVADPAAAVDGADVTVAVTTAEKGYVQPGWLKPGALFLNVSLDDLVEEAFLRADKLVIDDWRLISADEHRLLGRMARAGRVAYRPPGAVTDLPVGAKPIDATLGELVTGARHGRDSNHQVIVVNPFGMALADVALAQRVYDAARAGGHGVTLER